MNRFLRERPRPCRARDIVDEIEDEELKREYLEVVDDKTVSPATISTVMSEAKFPIAGMTIWRHRIGQCGCAGKKIGL